MLQLVSRIPGRHRAAFFAFSLLAAPLSLGTLRAEGPNSAQKAVTQQVVSDPAFKATVAAFEREYDHFVKDLITLTEIPAPPFGEKARGEAFAAMLRAAGMDKVEIDPEGNVLALRRGKASGAVPLLAVAAHLDTVFPAETDVRVKRAGTTLRAPGIGDDTRALAFVLGLVRALNAAHLETAGDILFIGNVGEEGPGDLRGVRYLFSKSPWKDRIGRFITVDGGNNDLITNGGLGSRRYRVTFKGPGGHSWGAFGLVNPAFAMGNAMVKFGQLKVPKTPKVSYNVGVVSGGTSVNSIPFEVSMEVDMRAVDPAALKQIDGQFLKLVQDAAAEENATRSTANGPIVAEAKLIGDRPSGLLSPETPILLQVAATMAAYEKVPVWQTGSTDANIPISLGIPAFAMSSQSGSRGGRAHSLDEWTDVEKTAVVKDFELAAAVILSVANQP